MQFLRGVTFAALGAVFCNPVSAVASEPVGEAVLIKTEVTGADGPLAVDDQVHRDERIKTSSEGLGQFVFRDGTKLAVGLGSSVVIDKFVFDDSDTVKKLTIRAAKGSFRWISGNSESSAYKILTPAGTIGVRGTAFDFYVSPNGTTAVVLLGGAVQFCGDGGCRQLEKRCDAIIAKPNGDMTQASRVNRDVLKSLRNDRALPFLSGNQQLSGRLAGVGAGGCGMGASTPSQPGTGSPRMQTAPAPQAPAPQAPAAAPQEARAETPSAPAAVAASPREAPAADPPASPPATPDPPSTPDDPPEHHHHRHHDHDHRDHDHDRRGWGHNNWGSFRGDDGDFNGGGFRGNHR